MTEQEIIQYLKENRNKGIAFAFVPEDVKNWCEKHKTERIFDCFQDGNWDTKTCIALCLNSVYALSDDYEPEKLFRPHWEELNIENGVFRFNDDGYHYWEVEKFLSDYVGYFNAFGGWLYSGGGFWSTNAMIHSGCNLVVKVVGDVRDVTPAIPTKIRFWRFKE